MNFFLYMRSLIKSVGELASKIDAALRRNKAMFLHFYLDISKGKIFGDIKIHNCRLPRFPVALCRSPF